MTGPDADESVRGSLSPEPTDDQRNELTRLIEERPWESDPEAALLTESESGWEDYGPQFLRSGIEAPGNPDAHQQADDAVTRAQADPEKVGHIFDNPTHDHQWEATGLDLEDNWNLIRETIEVNYSQIPDNGVYEVMQVFGSFTVSVRGAVVGGAVRIGTAWVNEL